eukprot:CAMPEP_0119333018 /NCGR_PEP_ID=MMETSP1333-20130426/84130_1 /TAXON_ID=418940 /ORGANISM="Scyphosphaera apsteinii, Strain RCC1455" /LENGTH=128 /DNA_ID=CAMNT_0007342959 /DNA_START=129 /DNA_END=512 /DNA_ORIENTATION=-
MLMCCCMFTRTCRFFCRRRRSINRAIQLCDNNDILDRNQDMSNSHTNLLEANFSHGMTEMATVTNRFSSISFCDDALSDETIAVHQDNADNKTKLADGADTVSNVTSLADKCHMMGQTDVADMAEMTT